MNLLRAMAAGLLAALAASPAGAQYLRDALAVGDLICEFRDGYRRSLVADLAAPHAADTMLIFEGIRMDAPEGASSAASGPASNTADTGSAAAYSSRSPGRRKALVRATNNAVHFIETVGPSVRVTTLSVCEKWGWKRGVETCVRFGARRAWHFDTLAARTPDSSFARQPSGASPGSCEAWNVD